MGLNLFNIKEDPARSSPREIYNWRVYVLAIAASWGSAAFGYDSAFIGGTLGLTSFKNDFGIDSTSSTGLQARIVSTFQAGCFFGAILIYFFNELYGRRRSLLLAGTVFNVGVILQLCSAHRIGMLYAGRALAGLGIGSSSLVIPQYISECAPAGIRGGLIGMFEILLQIGTVFGFWINYGVNKNLPATRAQWQIPVAVQFIPINLMIMMMYFMIETPRWLVLKGREEQALKNLTWLRQLPADHSYIQNEMAEYRAQLEHEMHITNGTGLGAIIRESFSPQIRSRIFIGCGLQLAQNTTGINAINYFSPSIFEAIGFSGTSVGLLATGVYGLVKTAFSTFSFIVLVDRFGRRPLLLIGSAGCILSLYYLAGFSSITHSFSDSATGGPASRAAIAMIYIYAMFYATSWNLSWIVCAEIFPTRVRSFCLVLTTCWQWLGQFIVVYSTPYMIENITYGTFLFFGSCTVVAFVAIWLFLPETKGVSLENMDLLFEKRGLAWVKRREYEVVMDARRNEMVTEVSSRSDASGVVGEVEKEKEESNLVEMA